MTYFCRHNWDSINQCPENAMSLSPVLFSVRFLKLYVSEWIMGEGTLSGMVGGKGAKKC